MAGETPREARSLSRQEFENDVICRAGSDQAFREQLLADPKAAIQSAYGIDFDPVVELVVLEETPTRFYLVLPAAGAELSDEQLGAVSGGVGFGPKVAASDIGYCRMR
jgi:hypothetical protein